MTKNNKLVRCFSLMALLSASLEEQAHAQMPSQPQTANPAQTHKNAEKVQAAFETKSTLSSSRDPLSTINDWQSESKVRPLQSKTTEVESNGLSALESLKQQASKFSRSLRSSQGLLEGRFESPGLFEFSNFVNDGSQTPANKKENVASAGSDEELDRLRVATIQSIEKLLRQPQAAHQRVELMLRLAELHAERHSAFLIKEMTRYEAAHERWQKNLRSGPEPKFSQSQSLQSLNAATQVLRNLVNQFPNHNRTPDALYQLGFLLTEMKSDSAALYFQRLIERFPKSNLIPDAQLALGEFYFSRNKFADALGYYQKAMTSRVHRAYPYAVYKLGWSFFNLRGSEEEVAKNLKKSLTAFKILVKYAGEADKNSKISSLRQDALRDMVLVYAELGEIDEAQKYFKALGEQTLYLSLLERLAWLHADAGRHQQAIEVYQRLLQEFPTHKRNPQHMVRLAALYDKEHQRNLMVDRLREVSEMLNPASDWWKAQASADDRNSAVKLLSSEANLWSLRLHSEFQKTKTKATAQQALTLYELAIRHHDEGAARFSALFHRAQLLTQLQEHDKAIDGYERAAQLDKKLSLRRPETQIALENAIAESDILIQQRGVVAKGKPQTIPVLETRLIRLIDLHASLFPKNPERGGLLHRAAGIHYRAGLIPQATQRWVRLAKESPQSPYVSDGLRLILKYQFDNSDWLKAITNARQFLAIQGIPDAPLGAQISKLLRVAIFQQGLNLEKSGQFADAARQFVEYQKEFPSDTDADKALINASNNYYKANRAEDAHSVLNLFVSNYPKSSYRERALEMLAMISEGFGRFGEAAKSKEQLALMRASKQNAAQDFAHAASLRLADNNPQKAIANAESALSHLKVAGEICSTFNTLIDAKRLSRSETLLESTQAAMQRCQMTSPEWGLYFSGLAAQLTLAAGKTAEAAALAGTTLSRGKTLSSKLQSAFAFEGLRLAGQVKLSVLENQSRSLLSRRVSQASGIQTEFAKIREDAQQLAQQYIQLAQAGQTEAAVGAIYRIAEIQEGLSNILVQTPSPQNSSPSESEAFRAKIEKIALPMQEEAAKLYAQALDKATDAEVMSPYTNLLKEKLSAIRPGEFRKSVEFMPAPSYFALELPNRKEVKGVVEEM